MMRRRLRREPERDRPRAGDASLVLALSRGEHQLLALLVVDSALEAINLLGPAVIDDALALFDRDEDAAHDA
jgi:hypothetical protein